MSADDLLVWLREQLDEDERLALLWRRQEWSVDGGVVVAGDPTDEIVEWVYEDQDGGREHIARWDPARVLREVAGNRRIIELHADDPEIEDGPACGVCSWRDDMEELQGEWPCLTARLLALPYSDRPGYRQEWAP